MQYGNSNYGVGKKIKNSKLNIIDEIQVFEALDIRTLVLDTSKSDGAKQTEQDNRLSNLKENFQKKYKHPWIETIIEVWRWYAYIFEGKDTVQHHELYKTYMDCIKRIEKEPMKVIKYEKRILLLKFEKRHGAMSLRNHQSG